MPKKTFGSWRSAAMLCVSLYGGGQLAQAQNQPPEAVGAADSVYKAALSRGRQSLASGYYAEAVQGFEAAIRARPDDVVALSELGWAALMSGDATRARTATTTALSRPQAPRLRAATLYNLGRVEEANGNAQAAVNAYRQSLALRQNSEVTGRLAAVDPSTSATAALHVQQLYGPVASLDAFCKRTKKDPKEVCSANFPSSEHFEQHETMEEPPCSMISALVMSLRTPKSEVNRCILGIQTREGWYGMELHSDNGCSPTMLDATGSGKGRPSMLALRILNFPAVIDNAGKSNERWRGYYQEWFYLCGVGATKKPSCMGPVDLGRIQQIYLEKYKIAQAKGEDVPPPEWEYRRTALVTEEGALRIKPEGWRLGEQLPTTEALGSHRILFP